MDRRSVIIGASIVMTVTMLTESRAGAAQAKTYDEAVSQVWRDLDPAGGALEVVRAGTLAANSHNTQPWRFKAEGRRVSIAPDYTRRCAAVDPDDHHLFASLGCAIENMVQAATVVGFKANFTAPAAIDAVELELEPITASDSPLTGAVTKRQCTRGLYDGKALSADDLKKLEAAGTLDGVECRLLTERARMDAVLEFVVQGNTAQMRDAAFMAELTAWIRFNDAQAVASMDGLSGRSSGNPSLPAWLARRLLPFVMTEKGENDKYAKHIRSSAGIAVFVAPTNDRTGWIAAGRAFQRFALQATAMDVRVAFINQPVEVPTLRPQIASFLGIGARRPNLIVRFGRGAALPPSLRRPVEAVVERR